MTDTIDIRPDGTIYASGLLVATVTASEATLMDLSGEWAFGAPEVIYEGVDQSEHDKVLADLSEAEEERDEAESELKSLRDEVRAFLANGTPCDVSLERLSEALGEDV